MIDPECYVATRVLAALALAGLTVTPANAQTEWDRAVEAVVRVSPSSFPQLPAPIVSSLSDRGCLIPQTFATPDLHNVVRGHFFRPGAEAWAVLCSVSDTSTILVFDDDRPEDPLELQRSANRRWLQGIGDGAIGFSRILGVAEQTEIARYNELNGPDEDLPSIEHDGIDEGFIEKGSTVWYWVGDTWRQLTGSD